jgi:hypothetical protein
MLDLTMAKEQDVLNFLFESSKKDSNQFYDIKPLAGNDALMIANKLLKSGFIKDDIQSDVDSVRCAISIEGIRSLDASYIEKRSAAFLEHTGEAGTIWNMVDLLKEKPEGFQFCFDLANDMQNRDLVKLLYAFYPSKVMVEMTLEGVRAAR